MPSITRLARLITLPETRRLIGRSSRIVARRGIRPVSEEERQALVDLLRNPTRTIRLAREATGHPAAKELATVSMVFLPMRYAFPATWVARRFLPRRRPVEDRAGRGGRRPGGR